MCGSRSQTLSALRWAPVCALILALAGFSPWVASAQPNPGVRMAHPIPDDPPDQTGAFDTWLEGFKVQARGQGISERTLERAFRGVRLNQRVIELNENQPEFSRAIWDYMDGAVSSDRVARGRKLARQYRKSLGRAERKYGVPASIVTAIWGLESNFGTNLGGFRVIEALATLAFEGRRAEFGREQLLAALKIIEEGDITPERMIGSWAGAMGQTQFIPTVFLQYAKDGNGDGRRNLWDTKADVFASTANYLKEKGWQTGAPCFDEVQLPQGFDFGNADISIEKPVREWADLSVTLRDGRALAQRKGQDKDAPAAILLPAGHKGPAFIAYPNFKVVLAYNNAISYALAICELSVRFNGGPDFRTPWPRDEQPILSRSERVEMQTLLAQRKYDIGEVDGVIGRRTREAIRAFQRSQGMPPDGFATIALLQRLRQAPA
ncbi:MAG: lytic murein transglycosylase [Alphaproteobacteria bacterium]|nr:lytic murein transglycosylase [Alphaproteobacteria bacterium]